MKKSRILFLAVAAILAITGVTAFTTPAIETHSNGRMINAPREVVWKVISDVGNYHRYATGLSGVTVISGEGKGMVRACSDELGSWRETCTRWDEGSSYSFSVDPGTGFPYPFKHMMGTWSVNEVDENFSELLIEFEYQFPYRWMSWFFNDDTHQAFDDGDKTLLDNWEKRISQGLMNLDMVLDFHFRATGAETLAETQTQTWVGKSNDTEFTLYQQKPKYARLDAKRDTVVFSQVYDGKRSWIIAPWVAASSPQETNYPDNRAIKTYSEYHGPLYHASQDQGCDLVYQGIENREDDEYFGFVVTYPNQDEIHYYLDVNSYLISAQVDYFKKDGSEVSMETRYEDYRNVAGVMLPFYLEQTFSFAEGKNEIIIQKVEFDNQLDQGMFRL